MPHPSARKGDKWEYDCEKGFAGLRRRNKRGQHDDWGDLEEIDEPRTWAIECKNSTKNLGEFIVQLEGEMKRSGRKRGVILLKRRMRNAQNCYAIMPAYVWDEIRQKLQANEAAAIRFRKAFESGVGVTILNDDEEVA